ncbi:tellurite resistance/C4-dicarboxylate transporter family protein [Desulfosporosinus sp. PR]|uniref:tellurite resistance/C4-dicarboxylate transporter family protein n=1 Tax=Candidatus Desulfosporosinus nitrosoreducens TaxID=3401928 RepID=UPI0027F54135|nr:tellurite resistance/C4-dicarboxylate transporter family protein [Desulfosporosinus sp. PR]MDQ7094352.1 tellurite resistance/C4-dicarboxylate transporter family protein [Desulfosporosinus sp. PR]
MREQIRNLHPASFAAVMATGIISIAFKGLGHNFIAMSLWAINIVLYPALFCLLALRILLYPAALLNDLKHPKKGFALLTFIAGTNTFGMQLISCNLVGLAKVLWFIGFVSWVFLVYFIIVNLIAFRNGTIADVVEGATLLTIVSTQSVALLGSTLAGTFGINSETVLFLAWTLWASGFILYLVIITLVTYRLAFCPLHPQDWTGPYWICMGAAAITTLAGATILSKLTISANWKDLIPFTKGITLLTWSIGTWWIPILLLMDVWKFSRLGVLNKVPGWIKVFPWLRIGFGTKLNVYEIPSWGRVFPLGMYTVCTLALIKTTNFTFLKPIPNYWGWFALTIWVLTFIGALRSMALFAKNSGLGNYLISGSSERSCRH